MFERIDHIALQVSNLTRSIAFYQNIFGFECYFQHTVKDKLYIAYLKLGDTILELFEHQQTLVNHSQHHFHLCLQTTNFEESMAKLQQEGLSLLRSTHSTPARKPDETSWQRATLLGPDAEEIEIRGPVATLN